MRILSLDLGTKSLGVCISDPNNLIAIPLENYVFEKDDIEKGLERVIELIEEYSITIIILGHPKRQDGTKSEMTLLTEQFKDMIIQSNKEVTVKLFDERYSTQRGIELLKQKYKTQEEINKNKDMAAAYIMLTDYLSTI